MATTINADRTLWRSSSLTLWRSRARAWLRAESKTFTALCGERFTRKEVLLAHLFVIVMLAACSLAEWLEGGAL